MMLIKFLLIGFMLGDKLQLSDIRIFGVIPTLCRIMTIIGIVYSVYYISKYYKRVIHNLNFVICFVIIWFLYSFFRFNIQNFDVFINQSLGFINFIILVCLVETKDEKREVYNFIAIVTCILIVLGCVELITGYHLGETRFHGKIVKYFAAGQLYNENDFSAFLAVMLPILCLSDLKKNIKIPFIALAFLIIMVNKSTIVLLSLFIVLIIYLLIRLYRSNIIKRKNIVFSLFGILSTIAIGTNFNWLISQTSFYYRRVMYEYGIKNCLNHFWLGSGVGKYRSGMIEVGFKEHALKFTSSDPHCLFLEIWGQYGFLVVATFTFLFLYNLSYRFRNYLVYNLKEDFIIFSFIVIFSISSLSSSTSLEKSYTWLGLIILAWYNKFDLRKSYNHLKEVIYGKQTK